MANDNDNNCGKIIRSIKHKKDTVILYLSGEINMFCAVELRGGFMNILRDKPSRMLIDMGKVEFMDSSGLAVLIESLQVMRKYGGQMALVSIPEQVRSILEISRLDSIFNIYENEDQAFV